MRSSSLRILAAAAAIALVLVYPRGSATVQADPYSHLTPLQRRLLSGVLSVALHPPHAAAGVRASAVSYSPATAADDECSEQLGQNVKVNQSCLNLSDTDLQGRGQAQNETAIAQDPFNPSHIVTAYNDYQLGDGYCGTSYSRDGGQHWNDVESPMNFTRGTAFGGVDRQYWDTSGDPSVAWDTRGNAYLVCEAFNRGPGTTNNPDQSSGVYLYRSTGNGGASWNFPGRLASEVLTSSPDGLPLLDKPYMTVDAHVGSPFRDRIYVTWALFGSDGTALIYEAHSDNYGQSLSAPVLVSTTSTKLCPSSVGTGGTCDVNQNSQPFTGPDGALYVVYSNFNNGNSSLNPNNYQVLISKSTDGGATFSAPVLVANYFDLPDCATYQNGQDFGVSCVPEHGSGTNSIFRATNYPVGAVNPLHPNEVVVTIGSYINRTSNEISRFRCVPVGFSPSVNPTYTGVKSGCNNKILLSVSKDAGASFTGGTVDPRLLPIVGQALDQAGTDQFWQWSAFTPGGKLVTSYYDRKYGSDETSGYSDISLAAAWDDTWLFALRRVTSSSMPPPTEFEATFLGDYSGLSASSAAFPLWTDTRNNDLALCPGTGAPGVPPVVCTFTEPGGLVANDQDIATSAVPIP